MQQLADNTYSNTITITMYRRTDWLVINLNNQVTPSSLNHGYGGYVDII